MQQWRKKLPAQRRVKLVGTNSVVRLRERSHFTASVNVSGEGAAEKPDSDPKADEENGDIDKEDDAAGTEEGEASPPVDGAEEPAASDSAGGDADAGPAETDEPAAEEQTAQGPENPEPQEAPGADTPAIDEAGAEPQETSPEEPAKTEEDTPAEDASPVDDAAVEWN